MKQTEHIHLGFELGSGEPVAIPLRHLVICGLTQRAGKTTTLEALVRRSGIKAIVFATKRGESLFEDAREIDPFFKPKADWQYVSQLLEAVMGERMKFERSWIIKVARGARTLEDVHHNVRSELKTAKGLSESVYTSLDAYFDLVLPEIRRARLADHFALYDGVNVMNLDHLRTEVQSLVIRSVIDEIYAHFRNTIVVIPEAWKFIPEGTGNPVKRGIEKLIREGAVLGNYVWVDSQDVVSIDKSMLKSVDVWLLGRQREINEIKRTIAQVPVRPKPRPEEIATLEIGQFVACFDKEARTVYVQPSWLEADVAQKIARGELPGSTAHSFAPSAPVVTPMAQSEYSTDEEVNLDWKEKYQESEKQRLALEEQVHNLEKRLERLVDPKTGFDQALSERLGKIATVFPPDVGGGVPVSLTDELYQQIRARLMVDPALLKVALTRPKIEVDVKYQTMQAEGDSLRGRIALLILEGVLDQPMKGNAVFELLKKTGKNPAKPNVYRELDNLRNMGFVIQIEAGYQAVDERKRDIVKRASAR